MRARDLIAAIPRALAHIFRPRDKGPKFECADCPGVMSCGSEPRENCLARLEFMARGDRRQRASWDPHNVAGMM